MSKLIIFDSSLPIKAIPEQQLNKIILTDFLTFVSGLLSLTDEVSANRLEIALPAIKEHCWSMGFNEIKKMFEMYVDNKLSIKPLPNYFDRILLGKIVEAYKMQKPAKKPKPIDISEEEKRKYIVSGMGKCFAHYESQASILDGYNLFLYDVLFDDGFLPKDAETKNKALQDAKQVIEIEVSAIKATTKEEHNNIKETLESIKKPRSLKLIIKAKELMVEKFLRDTCRDSHTWKQLKLKYEA